MSEGDVSLIRDEDILRRMWQQTEDFSRKKEIRAHMYRLREERLRNLYSPEPTRDGKGSEFTAAQDHVKSFADQSFQSMKSKEVRDAGSPPKEFTYRGQDLKALSNAGWNVEQENKTTDDGHTHVKSVHANIEGKYDVDGGRGQFAAVDHHKEAVTEYHDDNSSLKRNETSSNTAAREHVVRQTDDGTQMSSTTSSSTSTSKMQQMSSTRHESVPYVTNDDYDLRSYDTNRNEDASSVTRKQIIKTNDIEQNLRKNEQPRKNNYEQTVKESDYETGELVSRKVDYPDDNTRVIVETRCLPDGTRVTSTKKEFRAPVQSTRSEQSYQTRENRSYSTQQRSSDTRDSSSKIIRHVVDNRENRSTDIVDTQKNVDEHDFKRQIADYTTKDTDNYSKSKHYETKVNKKVIDHSKIEDDYSNMQHETKINRTIVDHAKTDDDYSNVHRYKSTTNKRVTDNSKIDDDYSQVQRHEIKVNQRVIDHSNTDVYNKTTHSGTMTHKIQSTENDDVVTHRDTKEQRYVTSDDQREKNIYRDDRTDTSKDYNNVPQTMKPQDNDSQPRYIRPSDHQPTESQPKENLPRSTDEKIHKIITDKKIEEVIEKKTNNEQYQTTYQTDYSQKKISNDWSPSHTAWASTLRADTPTSNRPSTRASSPGSRTFISSTSSLRSSVSPDKTNRKPSSRGSSPNKIDRSSPTRTSSDRHSTTYSTHSVIETKTHNSSTSEDRRPPTGRSPTRPGYSPERKPQDHRQRPSTSPEKRPYRSSVSPDRKPTRKSPSEDYTQTRSPTRSPDPRDTHIRPRESPERKLTQITPSISGYPTSPNRSSVSPEKNHANRHPKDSSIKPSHSPNRKPSYQKPDSASGHPPMTTVRPHHHTESPDCEPGYPGNPTDKLSEKQTQNTTPTRESISPDRKPGYMKPTASSQPSDNDKFPIKPSNKASTVRHGSSPSPTRKLQDDTTTSSKIREDHYKFIDEETKMYTRTDKTSTDHAKRPSTSTGSNAPKNKNPSPSRKSPNKDTDDINVLTRRRSPSPKQYVTITEKFDRTDTTNKTTDVTDNVTNTYCISKDKNATSDKSSTTKAPSPSKFGTYDKKKPYTEDTETTTTKDTKDTIKYDSLTRREKSPKKSSEQPVSPTKKGPRDSVSPVKSPTKETKYTTDFITTERTTEEINKKSSKDHPRKLVTPSSSPTRKSKRPTDTQPSTGQSSPTTSVSGFVYYSSPRPEKTIVTDLDDQELFTSIDESSTTYKRPESLDVKRSPSPSKIPCRSPSPEKNSSTSKDCLPRKSSLKKPSSEITQASPVEKPPSSFRVSPTEEPKEFPEHKVIKKDQPETPETKNPIKPKPPLERRETYEDRCRKILGMTEDTTENIKKQTAYLKEPEANLSSPSISPCRSPAPKESPFEYPTTKNVTDAKVDVTDFITREQDNIIKTTPTLRDGKLTDEKSKTLRDTSPTKLQNIISKEKSVIEHDIKETQTTTKYPSPRQSPERKPSYQPSGGTPSKTPKNAQKPHESPESPKNTKAQQTNSPRTSSSPERKPGYQPKEKTPSNELKDKSTVYVETTTTVSHNYDTAKETEEITVTTKATERKPSRSSKSPTRKTPGTPISKQLSDKSPQRKPEPTQKPETDNRGQKKSSPTKQVYLESTTSMVAEYDSTEDLDEIILESDKTKNPTSTSLHSSTRKHHRLSDDSVRKPSHAPTRASPEKEQSGKDSSNIIKQVKIPGYMRTTESVSSKHDSTTTESVKETTAVETTERHHAKRPSVSPTRKISKTEKTYIHASRHPDIDDKTEKSPHYMTAISPHSHVHHTELAIEDEYEKRSSTIQYSSPIQSNLPTHQSQTEEIPHYMRPISPHRHTHQIATEKEFETRTHDSQTHNPNLDTIPHYMTPYSPHSHIHQTEPAIEDEYEKRTSTIHYSSPIQSDLPTHQSQTEEIPHYMRPISPHRHTHQIATEKEFETRTHDSQTHNPNLDTIPHYMTPYSPHSHIHQTEPAIEDEYEKRTSTIHYSSPIQSDLPTHQSQTEEIPHYMRPISPHRHTHQIATEEEIETRTHDSQTHKPNQGTIPHYMTPTSTYLHKHDEIEICTSSVTEDVSKMVQNKHSESPVHKAPRRDDSPRKPAEKSPDRKLKNEESPNINVDRRRDYSYPKDLSPTRQTPSNRTPGYMKTTSSVTSKYDSTSEDIVKNITSSSIERRHPISHPSDSSLTQKACDNTTEQPRTESPSKPHPNSSFTNVSMPKDSISKKSENRHSRNRHTQDTSPTRPSSSPDRKPGYMRPTASISSKHETTTTEDVEIVEKYQSPRSSVSPSRISPDILSKTQSDYLKEPEKSRHLRTPSPNKKTTKVTEINSDFLISEREQEILDRVQKSLRKLSPDRKEQSPSRERSPSKTTTSLQDIDITTNIVKSEKIAREQMTEFTKGDVSKTDITNTGKPKDEKPKDQKASSKPSSRNVSPTKKPSGIVSPVKIDRSTESPAKPRSISPKKPASPTEQSRSPHVPKTSGIKPKEQIPPHLTRKPTPATLNVAKVDKTVTDLKKTTGITSTTKQNSFTKMTTTKTTGKVIQSSTGRPSEPLAPTPKGMRESGIPRKETDPKVTRTASDIAIKSKRPSNTSPQRMRSKPEIQVSDMSTTKTTSKTQKSSLKESHSKLPSKPKSATTLNTPSDEDDIIIDVQQSKSSRENSPDRICPTPVNFADDVGTPRYPDEVKEPDDESRRRVNHTIHEAESIVDDIVEICEDDELFVRKSDIENLTEEDESFLSVTDKVTRFSKGINTKKPKDTTVLFKDTERKVHSDFVEQNLKSDECLLSVSEKVNKFAKGPKDTKDRSPARKVVDEYDRNTVYTDDYTKLSVHDKAHLFVETAENVKAPKVKPAPQKVERPDLTNVDEALKSDDCLLSVSDKVHKFVKTAEQFLTESHEVEEKDKKIKEQHDIIMKQIVDDEDDDIYDIERTTATEDVDIINKKIPDHRDTTPSFARETTSSHEKVKENITSSLKPTERAPPVKITTLRSSEAVKKAKALFENIASSTQKTKETIASKTTTKLTDIGVIKKSPKTDSTTVLHPSAEEISPDTTDMETEDDVAPHYPTDRLNGVKLQSFHSRHDDKPRESPTRLTVQVPEGRKSKSPMRQTVETITTTKTVLTKYPATQRAESPKHRPENDKTDKIPGYLRPTKTSQIKDETKVVEETEVSSRRGSGKFGVELRRTSAERSTVSSERRRSVEHPCIEDIFDLDLLEQMLEKVVGYEQRRRIRAQIRIARKKSETDHLDSTTHTYTRTTKQTMNTNQKTRSPEPHHTRSPDHTLRATPQKYGSPDRYAKTPQRSIPERSHPKEHVQPVLNGHAKEPVKITNEKRQRPRSPEKPTTKSTLNTKSPIRHGSPDKKARPHSPTKTATPKPKANRFNEYATAYMKKVGLSEADKLKFAQAKKKTAEDKQKTVQHVKERKVQEEFSTAKSFTERTSSKDVIEVIQLNGNKRSPSPEKRQSPDRKALSPERFYEQSPSPVRKQPVQHTKSEPTKKETIIKTVYEIEKKTPQKQVQEEKPSWVTNRNLKKITSETRTFSSKKIEEKPKYRAPSPSKVITKPIDVITSSYGPGPLDADGKPLFGIRALRNGASNYQVKGTVIRQEYHSRNGGEPEGTVSVTAYSTEPEELEQLLQRQGEQPSRIHGLAAITTTKKFGGDTGTTLKEIHGREERATIDQFTHSDRRVSDTRIEDITDSYDSRHEILGDSRRVDTRREEIVEDIVRDQSDKTDRMQKRVEKTERKGDKGEKRDRPDDKKTVRQSSVKSLTEKYIKSTNESSKTERTAYPKAGLILRTTTMKDSVSSDSSHAGLTRTSSDHSLGSEEDTVVTTERCEGGVRTVTTTRTHGHVTHGSKTDRAQKEERSFLDSSTKVTGVQDILTRMKNADIVIQEGDSSEDTEARALLNKFLGATVLMAGMQSYVTEKPTGKVVVKQETVRTSSSGGGKVTSSQTRNIQEFDVDQCWDDRLLKKLLDECNDYEQRRRLRARIRTLMAEQEACASAVTEALAAAGETPEDSSEAREEEEVTVTSSVRRNSSEKTVSSSTTTTKTSKVIESMTRPAPKPVSPFAKFRQLEKQNSTNSPNSASPKSPGSPAPYFKFTDPALQASAVTIKERLLQWCRDKTRDYENVKLENFSTSWADGLAFCALLHHFLPDTFDYSKLTPETRRHNFTLAFKIADEKAGIYPLLDVDDMVTMRKPDWKCVFTYVQSIYRRFKDD